MVDLNAIRQNVRMVANETESTIVCESLEFLQDDIFFKQLPVSKFVFLRYETLMVYKHSHKMRYSVVSLGYIHVAYAK